MEMKACEGDTGEVTSASRSSRACSNDTPLRIESEPIDSPQARDMLACYVEELNGRFSAGFDTSRSAPPAPGDFTPPAGVFLIVRSAGVPAGCAALRTEGNGIGEIRRMWISPRLRGQGAGRALLRELEDQARRYGCRTVRLDTAAELTEAHALYVSAGYREVPAYNDNPYAAHWFEKELG